MILLSLKSKNKKYEKKTAGVLPAVFFYAKKTTGEKNFFSGYFFSANHYLRAAL